MVTTKTNKLLRAYWETPERGIVNLSKDWSRATPPQFFLDTGQAAPVHFERVPPQEYGKQAGYFKNDAGQILFLLWPDSFPNVELEGRDFFLAGDFNQWDKAIGNTAWQMQPATLDQHPCYLFPLPPDAIQPRKGKQFKFVSSEGEWLEASPDMPNCVHDAAGIFNLEYLPQRTGHHAFYFYPSTRASMHGHEWLIYRYSSGEERCRITYGDFLCKMGSTKPLGACINSGITHFRLFAPRATQANVTIRKTLDDPAPLCLPMTLDEDDGVWETVYDDNLHGHYYYYTVDGENPDAFSHFNADFNILDPYAIAAVSSKGPGIIYDFARLARTHTPYEPPRWHDLIILEAHVRDLLAHAPTDITAAERQGFAGLTQWLKSEDCYLRELGINAVELQPIQEFDNQSKEEYHWGYMTCNYFSPDSTYAQDPTRASQIEDFRALVDAFHAADIAVILDVVYNHVGEPNHLIHIDKQYYFEMDSDGQLTNWSGCGNDLKCENPMTKRLIIDSLIHLVKVYDVDGFRFDLAELVGVDVLKDVEKALKAVKPSIILIAEPWSFRGHIAHALRHTGWASWNDGYRDFLEDYVKTDGNFDGMRYFLQGSPFFFARFPAQTINYTESHDDRCWLDRLTTNPDHNGYHPTLEDRRRTHLMCAILMASLGVPMLAAGQDMLRSKHGINNTYQRGDVNALNYERQQDFPQTYQYFRDWIRFRLSDWGYLLRLNYCPQDDYFQFIELEHSSALAVLYNANFERGNKQLFFAVNPHYDNAVLPLKDINLKNFQQIADHERFNTHGLSGGLFRIQDQHLHLHAVSCGLWARE